MRIHTILTSALAAAAQLAATGAAAAVVTTTPGTPTFNGVTAAGSATTSAATNTFVTNTTYASTTTTKTEKDVVTAPTATSAGQAYVYEVTTVNTQRTDTLGSFDAFTWSQNLGNNTAGNEFVTFSATLNATQAINAQLSFSSFGSYTALTSPFGSSVPALPSFYVRLAGDNTAWTLVGANNSTSTGSNSFSSSAYWSLGLDAGTPKTFEVAVLAGPNVDLGGFTVNVTSSLYGIHTQVTDLAPNVTRTLVGAELLAPVPEPETYALLAAGLLFVVSRLRNQRR
jgi:hypothetical protein